MVTVVMTLVNYSPHYGLCREKGGIDMNGFWVAKHSFSGRALVLLALAKYDMVSGNLGSRNTYRIYRPATGEHDLSGQVLSDRYRRVNAEEAKAIWEEDYTRSAHVCMHGPSCRQGHACEAGKRIRVLYILSGALLSIWGRVEECLNAHQRGRRTTLKVIRVMETVGAAGAMELCTAVIDNSSSDGNKEVLSVPELLSQRKQILGIQLPMTVVKAVVEVLKKPPIMKPNPQAMPLNGSSSYGYLGHHHMQSPQPLPQQLTPEEQRQQAEALQRHLQERQRQQQKNLAEKERLRQQKDLEKYQQQRMKELQLNEHHEHDGQQALQEQQQQQQQQVVDEVQQQQELQQPTPIVQLTQWEDTVSLAGSQPHVQQYVFDTEGTAVNDTAPHP